MAAVTIESMSNEIIGVDDLQKPPKPLEPVNGLTEKVAGDSFDEWQLIENSSFTHGFLVQSLRTNDVQFVQQHATRPIKQVEAEDISKNKGFASVVYKATIHFSGSVPAYTTILKVPGIASIEEGLAEHGDILLDFDLERQKVAKFHAYECDFYKNVAATLDLPTPRVHLTSPWILGENEGFLHMEDMSVKAVTGENLNPLSVSQIFSVCRQLAKIHKKTITDKKWHGKYLANVPVLVGVSKMIEEAMGAILEHCGRDETLKKLIQKFAKFSANPDFVKFAFVDSWKELGLDPVFVHGDLWGGNVMWLFDEFKQPTAQVGAFLDWQLMHEGSLMTDLARIVTLCTDSDTRRLLESQMFDFYLAELTGLFAAEGVACPVELDQVKKAYQIMFLSQAIFMPLLAVFISKMKDPDSAEGVEKAREDKLLLRTRHAFEDMDKLATGDLKWVFDRFNV